MSTLSRSARTPFVEKVLQEFSSLPIRFDFYSQKPSNLNGNPIYFSAPTVYTPKGTVTSNTIADTGQPAGVNTNNIFSYSSTNQPRVCSEVKDYPSIITGAINSGGTFTGFSVTPVNSDWFRLAYYTLTSDTIKLVFANPTGADTLTFSAIPVVAGWNYIEKKFGDGVTAGSFSFNTAIVSLEITTAASGRTVAPYELQIANNQEIFIGNQKTIIFDALVEVGFDISPETKEIMNYNYVSDTSVSGFKAKVTFKVNVSDELARASALGSSLKKETFTVNTAINAEAGAANSIAIASNIITNTAWIGYTTRQLAVVIDGVTLTAVESTGAVTSGTYNYATATGVFTFASADGKIPTIYAAVQTTAQGFTYEDLTNGMYGAVLITRKLSSGQTMTFEALKAQLISTKRDQSDGNLSNSYEIALYGKKVGTKVQFFKESIS